MGSHTKFLQHQNIREFTDPFHCLLPLCLSYNPPSLVSSRGCSHFSNRPWATTRAAASSRKYPSMKECDSLSPNANTRQDPEKIDGKSYALGSPEGSRRYVIKEISEKEKKRTTPLTGRLMMQNGNPFSSHYRLMLSSHSRLPSATHYGKKSASRRSKSQTTQ